MWRAGNMPPMSKAQHAGPTLLNMLQGHGIAGLVGLLGIVWAAIQIFINGSTVMNAAWQTTGKAELV